MVTLSNGHIRLALQSPEKRSAVAAAHRRACVVTSGSPRSMGVWHSGSSKASRLAMEAPAVGV